MIAPLHKTESLPPGAGRSSFDLIDAAKLMGEIPLKSDISFLDLGCGEGKYTMAIADQMGLGGVIYALDLWEEGITKLQERLVATGRDNIKAMVADVAKVPLDDRSIDLCLMATVLHDLKEFNTAAAALREVARVIKPSGVLAIVEFEKVEGPPGPPLRIRLTAEEVELLVAPYGFKRQKTVKVGPYNYLITFTKRGEEASSRD